MAITEKVKLTTLPLLSEEDVLKPSRNIGNSYQFIIDAAEKRRRLASHRALQMQAQMGIASPMRVVK